MDPAQKIEISCDRIPAQHRVGSGLIAAIGDRLGTWKIVVHERHGGHCWDVRINPPQGAERHFVFLGDECSPDHIGRTIERDLRDHAV